MPTDPGPFVLDDTRLVIGPDGNATTKAVSPGFYQELDTEFGSFAGHILVSEHEFKSAWPTWEMHPAGDELVYLLEGDVDFVLWVESKEQTVHVDRPGSYVVVPKGIWHTARPNRPTRMLFFTPGEGTRNAEQPES